MSDHQTNPNKPRSKRGMIAIATAALIAMGGAWSLQSFASSKTVQHMKVHTEDAGGWFSGKRQFAGWRHNRHHSFLDMSDTEIKSKLTRMMKHVAIEIDATQEQQDKIITLASNAVKELRPLRDSMRTTGHAMHELLLSDAPDRAAMEKLRVDRLADADRVSKKLMGTVADIAELLSPAQRKLLDERIKEFRGRKGWHRG